MAYGGGKLPRLLALKLIGRNNGLRFMGRSTERKERRLMKRDRALEAIRDWLTVRPDSEYDVLFTSLDHNTLGKPLSLTSIYPMVQRIGEKVGIKKIVSPHKIRHSAITAYLEASDGDRRGGASFARHSDLSVTQVDDDHRKRQQKKATKILSDLA
jgi:integrase/recombinase XerC